MARQTETHNNRRASRTASGLRRGGRVAVEVKRGSRKALGGDPKLFMLTMKSGHVGVERLTKPYSGGPVRLRRIPSQ